VLLYSQVTRDVRWHRERGERDTFKAANAKGKMKTTEIDWKRSFTKHRKPRGSVVQECDAGEEIKSSRMKNDNSLADPGSKAHRSPRHRKGLGGGTIETTGKSVLREEEREGEAPKKEKRSPNDRRKASSPGRGTKKIRVL